MGSGMIANTAQKMMNRRDQQAAMMKQLLGRSKGGPVKKKVKKEEVELVNEMPLPGAGKQCKHGFFFGWWSSCWGTPANASTAALALGRSKGGLVKKKKSYKESLEIFEKKKELSIDDQMRISRSIIESLLKRRRQQIRKQWVMLRRFLPKRTPEQTLKK